VKRCKAVASEAVNNVGGMLSLSSCAIFLYLALCLTDVKEKPSPDGAPWPYLGPRVILIIERTNSAVHVNPSYFINNAIYVTELKLSYVFMTWLKSAQFTVELIATQN